MGGVEVDGGFVDEELLVGVGWFVVFEGEDGGLAGVDDEGEVVVG